MVALDWLCSLNKDLVTVGCTDAEKVRFAAHLLEGPAASWWGTFQITHPIDTVTWTMFEEGFKTNHVSSGVLSLKRKEFRNLRQTNRTVADYIEEFNNLSRYAPEDVDTDAKRRERFLDGLSDELSLQLSLVYCPTFQELMDNARILEGKHQQVERCKRKHNDNYNSGSNQRTRRFHHDHGNSGYHRNGGNGQNNHGENGHHHNGHKSENHHNSEKGNGHNNGGNNGRNNKNIIKRDIRQVECFRCHKNGHYANDCPERKNDEGNKTDQIEEVHVNLILQPQHLKSNG
jgi:hypothetical protein